VTYDESIEFLFSLIDYERWVHRNYSFKLSDYLVFLEKMGNPQKKLKRVVLVAGTKGKGSTAIMLARILESHGEKVGLYTSPHLADYRERIAVNKRKIPDKRFAEIVEQLKPAIEAHKPRITFFEAMTIVGFYYFLAEETTLNVLEVGLGGRLDATNVTEPELSVITRIGYDHTQTLGNTLAKIAGEKCGVLRPGKFVVVGNQRPRARRAIREEVEKSGVKGIWWNDDFSASLTAESVEGLSMHYRGLRIQADFTLPLLGAHQIENAATAIAAAEALLDELDENKVGHALALIQLPSRIQKLQDDPAIILDMSHNQESAAVLRKTLDKHFAHHPRRVLLIGVSKHKDKSKIIQTLAPFFSEVWVTQADQPRAESRQNLLRVCSKVHPNCREAASVAHGINAILDSLDEKGEGGLLVISGSIYVAGEALKALKER
jgi:dihydrofolate synthase/folylpolyglutamate synthase